MDSYNLLVSRSVHHDLERIDRKEIPRILEAIKQLREDPLPRGCTKLRGAEREYRIRVGVYRVIYEVDQGTKNVMVYHIRHRKDAYRDY